MSIKYIASEELIRAKQVSEFLNRPLLLSGEPGTGKTQFAHYISEQDDRTLFIFNTKSTSQSRDLFYNYDTLGHFAEKEKTAVEFITLEALGKAIVNAYGPDRVKKMLLEDPTNNFQLIKLRSISQKEAIVDRLLGDCSGKRSIVLVDEVDKAPRDFPNDILNEIENLEFEIRELNFKLALKLQSKDINDKILVLLTSNFEKNLPEAFLRRCIYYHIEFLEDVNKLKEIVNVHISTSDQGELEKRIEEFLKIRKTAAIQKKPATSELIDCVKWLIHDKKLGSPIQNNIIALSTLLKKNEDLRLFTPGR